ncbi:MULTISPECIES: AmmeMemoRadiSam system radical SAM enzyme [Kosmotoga]|jgi:pyruvate formate lyase activating enzyme|uniref:Radical SAM domain protein n=1 Tax=Kosmotoga olearia (strain ATCC BAA-1733 / DSM 21960 / TBF 19.5.1) TaxID=521045 RepID=C5CFH4_KOSOT|nr:MULTISPECIES: AmmeMemoRadiSam system radical SAM enzyme [Kosmotoga]ACR80382.1 Radical SAM domain protein [Kosmotoga olearia TBF 19.5.1]MDI3524616.1 pyruvate formate lyase activating enzyme [Kosmotoga sp.]MDK2953359.1 pyruvate formate lyase activating enzyme [Kosmotoga sp.]
MKPAIYFDELEGDVLQCHLCPNRCIIRPGETGICKARKNVKGMLYSLNYGELTSIGTDPIEKKPLYHFYPGTMIFSVGSWGCNLSCDFCQNWEISKGRPRIVQRVIPHQLIEIARSEGTPGLAFTYNEPTVSFEFVLDTSRAAAKEGIYSVLITNGYIEQEPLKLLVQSISAMNIDLKGWNDEFYAKELGASKKHVLDTIEFVLSAGVHVEITTLIIPGKNDSLDEMREEAKWLASLSRDIPLHITRYFPNYKYTIPPTDVKTLNELHNVAKEHLNYVYIGNVPSEDLNTTYCPDCGTSLIKRRGFDVEIANLTEESRCSNCGKEIPVIL